jgi:hypothetical protein
MSDSIVLRKVYALNSNTGLFLSANQILLTDGKGGTQWGPFISSLTSVGGPIIGDLPSTFSTISSQLYRQSNAILDLQQIVGTLEISSVGPLMESTVIGLGTAGFVSSTQLFSTVNGLGQRYVSTPSLQSTVAGLGTAGYISSLSFQSSLFSTVGGLGSIDYVSTSFMNGTLISSFQGLTGQPFNYINSNIMNVRVVSTVRGLSELGYISSSGINSTIEGLGSFGYVSSSQLASTTTYLLNRPVSFDDASNVIINSATTISIVNASAVYFKSSFTTSSLGLIGTMGTEYYARMSNTNDMVFSTATFNLSSVSSFIFNTSKVLLEYNPMLLFAKLSNSASGPAVLHISTFLQYDTTVLGPMTTNFIFATTGSNTYNGGVTHATSTLFQQPIRFEVPLGTMATRKTSDYTFLHMIPNAVNTTRLANSTITAFFHKDGASANISVFNTT